MELDGQYTVGVGDKVYSFFVLLLVIEKTFIKDVIDNEYYNVSLR